jgi:hypothetical protein
VKLRHNTLIGTGLILVAVVLALLVGSFGARIMEMNDAGCDCADAEIGGFCPHSEGTLPIEVYIGYTISAVLALIGAYLIISDMRAQRINSASAESWKKVTSALKGEEKTIYELIASADGVMFQSDIVEKSGVNKVKVSRVLDGLEARGLVERRRRGMSNVIMLKAP